MIAYDRLKRCQSFSHLFAAARQSFIIDTYVRQYDIVRTSKIQQSLSLVIIGPGIYRPIESSPALTPITKLHIVPFLMSVIIPLPCAFLSGDVFLDA